MSYIRLIPYATRAGTRPICGKLVIATVTLDGQLLRTASNHSISGFMACLSAKYAANLTRRMPASVLVAAHLLQIYHPSRLK